MMNLELPEEWDHEDEADRLFGKAIQTCIVYGFYMFVLFGPDLSDAFVVWNLRETNILYALIGGYLLARMCYRFLLCFAHATLSFRAFVS